MEYYVYILTNKTNHVLYTGVTNDLTRRTLEHIYKIDNSGFAERCNCNKLVFYEITTDIKNAIEREKHIKGMNRVKKIKLIENFTPQWNDLFI